MTTNSSTALITGGTSGIGRATANKLAQLGFHVLVLGRNSERGNKTVDLTSGEEVERVAGT
jgi:NAD(P)-dependent dehydrogenase (short-subunit alcohol dehydrogenase family)